MRDDPAKGPELERRLSLLKGKAAEEFRLLLEQRRRIVGILKIKEEEVSNEVEVLPQPPMGFVYVVEDKELTECSDAICLAKLDADGKPGATIYIADARDLRVLKRKRRCSADGDATKRARHDAPPNVELGVAQGQKRPRDDLSDLEKHMGLKRTRTDSDQSGVVNTYTHGICRAAKAECAARRNEHVWEHAGWGRAFRRRDLLPAAEILSAACVEGGRGRDRRDAIDVRSAHLCIMLDKYNGHMLLNPPLFPPLTMPNLAPVPTTADMAAITPAEDKEFKRKALALNGKQPDAVLQRWLDRYMPLPTKVRPPGYVSGGAVRERVRERARARKERVDRLLALRAAPRRRGVIITRPVLIATTRPPGHIPGMEAWKEREERRARNARVAQLMKLRASGIKGGVRPK
ncbi:hypothetical protein B0H11DRAFT_1926748 [Mycena galericulata]|nr:hypothetical protein B0H11DRAFT_1926748 [Mycena galericulata]